MLGTVQKQKAYFVQELFLISATLFLNNLKKKKINK